MQLTGALARLDALIDWEKRDRRAGMRMGLGPAEDLVRRLGEPQGRYKVVHVAGTKGKGTVAALVAAGLANAGLRTGCYASPHVERMNERIRLQGRDLADSRLEEAVERHSVQHLLFNVHPWLDSLRSDPRYHAILERMNLE